MKKVIYILISGSLLVNANYSVKQIENMVLKIHNKRPGLDVSVLENTYEPFVMKEIIKKNDTEKEIVLKSVKKDEKIELHAILADKAYINDKWLKVNDTINGYQLKYIGKRGVVLQNGNEIKKLLFHDKKNNLIKLEGR
ncbi:MAG: hypothetical protein ABGW74_01330 [Campylobacterales bacterium]